MPSSLSDPEVLSAFAAARAAAATHVTKSVTVNGVSITIPTPFPSPVDWRECPIYFLLLDRFNNPVFPPAGTWNRRYNFRQGGTFQGVTDQLDYLQQLGVRAIWLSPVLKNSRPDWEYNYHGYGAQSFLDLDPRFASDGTLATAQDELTELVDQAHARGMFVILDIVLNHAARVFDYVMPGGTRATLSDGGLLNGPLGTEPPVQWLNGLGFPRSDWQNRLDDAATLHPDDAIWPSELQNHTFFRRRGSKVSDEPDSRGFVRGDFDVMRQLVVEYDASVAGQEPIRDRLGSAPVLNVLIRAYAYLVARYDFDGFRIDTVKYVAPESIETFGNAIREYASTIGKRNFFTFGEVFDDEETIARFTGRNGGEGFGIDAALDFPLFFVLPGVAKGRTDVATLRRVFEHRKSLESQLLSSHGEAGRYFVSFLENHDQPERFHHPSTPLEQVTLGYALLFTLQGIPCIYYGAEQGLSGTVDAAGRPDLASNESTREALWGAPAAFSSTSPIYRELQRLAEARRLEPALSFGRFYFREVSGNGVDFGQSAGPGGIVAFSRILADREALVVANTGQSFFHGSVIVDRELHAREVTLNIVYSNTGSSGTAPLRLVQATFYGDRITSGQAMAVKITLAPNEVQILT